MHHLSLVHLLSQQETGLDHSSQHDVHSYYAVSETEADLRWASRIVYFHYVSFLAYPGSCNQTGEEAIFIEFITESIKILILEKVI